MKIRFDLSGGSPGNPEFMLGKLREDFFFGFPMEIRSEEDDGQQNSGYQGYQRQIFFHTRTPL